MEGCIVVDGGNGRWTRHETLTLLEIRSCLDRKFKVANQKGPLWDEISRIMAEEHGYQRSGKKCRKKFENLYKYYKKTKEGKAGRQDGKHYRFFGQLEALCGETTSTGSVSVSETQTHLALRSLGVQATSHSSPKGKHCEFLSFSRSLDLDSSDEDDEKMEDGQTQHKRRRKSWKAKIRDFVDSKMRRLLETQEAWLEKMLRILERKEQERIFREEAWRQEEATRLAHEFKFWAHDRAWVEARHASLMEALQKFNRRELEDSTHENSKTQNENGSYKVDDCTKSCREKWESTSISVNNHRSSVNKCNKWCKENSRNQSSFRGCLDVEGIVEKRGEILGLQVQSSDAQLLPSNSNPRNGVQDSYFGYLMDEEDTLWENYNVKLNRGENQ